MCDPTTLPRRICCEAAVWTLLTGLAVGGCLALQAAVGSAQEGDADRDTSKQQAVTSRAEIRDRQYDVAIEARDIEQALGKLKKASELARQRIGDAAERAEAASGAIERGDSKAAQTEAEQAAAMFQEIVKQLEALLAEQTPQRIAAAQNLAQQLSQAERDFLRSFPGALLPFASGGFSKVDPRVPRSPRRDGTEQTGTRGPGSATSQGTGADGKESPNKAEGSSKQDQPGDRPRGGSPEGEKKSAEAKGSSPQDDVTGGRDREGERGAERKGAGKREGDGDAEGDGEAEDAERREALARRAEQLAEQGRTLQDILQAIAGSTDPGDADAVRMVDSVLRETDLTKSLEQLQRIADQLRSGDLEDARVTGLDIADRLEIAAQRLGNAYRLIVAPQAEALRELEKSLAILREELDELETPSQVAEWHRKARELLDQLEQMEVSDELRQELQREITLGTQDQVGIDGGGGWVVVKGRYAAPSSYQKVLLRLQEDLQMRMQNLLLGDLDAAPDEATPPKYQEFVERYYEVLSRERGGGSVRTPAAAPPP